MATGELRRLFAIAAESRRQAEELFGDVLADHDGAPPERAETFLAPGGVWAQKDEDDLLGPEDFRRAGWGWAGGAGAPSEDAPSTSGDTPDVAPAAAGEREPKLGVAPPP